MTWLRGRTAPSLTPANAFGRRPGTIWPFSLISGTGRQALCERDKIHYTIRPSGEVVLTRSEASESDDPVLGQFLGFLARDIASHPERVQTIDAAFVQRTLTGGIEVDLDAPLPADDE